MVYSLMQRVCLILINTIHLQGLFNLVTVLSQILSSLLCLIYMVPLIRHQGVLAYKPLSLLLGGSHHDDQHSMTNLKVKFKGFNWTAQSEPQ